MKSFLSFFISTASISFHFFILLVYLVLTYPITLMVTTFLTTFLLLYQQSTPLELTTIAGMTHPHWSLASADWVAPNHLKPINIQLPWQGLSTKECHQPQLRSCFHLALSLSLSRMVVKRKYFFSMTHELEGLKECLRRISQHFNALFTIEIFTQTVPFLSGTIKRIIRQPFSLLSQQGQYQNNLFRQRSIMVLQNPSIGIEDYHSPL